VTCSDLLDHGQAVSRGLPPTGQGGRTCGAAHGWAVRHRRSGWRANLPWPYVCWNVPNGTAVQPLSRYFRWRGRRRQRAGAAYPVAAPGWPPGADVHRTVAAGSKW